MKQDNHQGVKHGGLVTNKIITKTKPATGTVVSSPTAQN